MTKEEGYNEKFEEGYLKTKAQVDYEKMNFNNVEKFSKITTIVGKIILFLISIFGIFVIIYVIMMLSTVWKGI